MQACVKKISIVMVELWTELGKAQPKRSRARNLWAIKTDHKPGEHKPVAY